MSNNKSVFIFTLEVQFHHDLSLSFPLSLCKAMSKKRLPPQALLIDGGQKSTHPYIAICPSLISTVLLCILPTMFDLSSNEDREEDNPSATNIDRTTVAVARERGRGAKKRRGVYHASRPNHIIDDLEASSSSLLVSKV